jgi:hyperosmotically inducible protein
LPIEATTANGLQLSVHHANPAKREVETMTTKPVKIHALVLGALIALGAAGCASGPDNSYAGNRQERTATQSVSDSALSAKIKTEFATTSGVKAHEIHVDAMRGVVTLTGTVATAAERDKAISIARDTKGVVEVKDHIKVAG